MLFVFFAGTAGLFAQNDGGNGNVNLKEDSRIPELMELKAELTRKNRMGGRYKIQLGSFSSIESAEQTIKKFEKEYEEYPAQLEYESPNYKVWVGDFTSRLSAERAFIKLKKEFKSAFVFKPNS